MVRNDDRMMLYSCTYIPCCIKFILKGADCQEFDRNITKRPCGVWGRTVSNGWGLQRPWDEASDMM